MRKKKHQGRNARNISSVIPNDILCDSIETKDNWSQYFISAHIFDAFKDCMVDYSPNLFVPFRGERTGWDPMFIIPQSNVEDSGVADRYLTPFVKSSAELHSIAFEGEFENRLLVCKDKIEDVDKGTKHWVERFENQKNKNGSKMIPEACKGHKPYWYSLNPKLAQIVTSINPYERFFFTYSQQPIAIGQRLIALNIAENKDVELAAALLNSVVVFLEIELKGTDRNLGVLDLNANYIKQLQFLNAALLSEDDKDEIKKRFKAISHRTVLPIYEETRMKDRIDFDKTILRSFNIDVSILDELYEMLVSSVESRVTMKNK